MSQQGVPKLQCHCHSKLGDPQARYLPRSWQTNKSFLERSRTLVLEDLEMGPKVVLGLTETKWLLGEASELGNSKQGMKPCKLLLSAGVFLCLWYKTRRVTFVTWWQWAKVCGPQRRQDRLSLSQVAKYWRWHQPLVAQERPSGHVSCLDPVLSCCGPCCGW